MQVMQPSQSLKPLEKRPLAAIYDIDGVLCDMQPFLRVGWEDSWGDTFHNTMHTWQPLDAYREVIRHQRAIGIEIHIVTNRPKRYRDVTHRWLEEHQFEYDLVWLRPNGGDLNHKVSTAQFLQMRYRIVGAFEDDPRTVQQYLELGIPGILVPSGYYEQVAAWDQS